MIRLMSLALFAALLSSIALTPAYAQSGRGVGAAGGQNDAPLRSGAGAANGQIAATLTGIEALVDEIAACNAIAQELLAARPAAPKAGAAAVAKDKHRASLATWEARMRKLLADIDGKQKKLASLQATLNGLQNAAPSNDTAKIAATRRAATTSGRDLAATRRTLDSALRAAR